VFNKVAKITEGDSRELTFAYGTAHDRKKSILTHLDAAGEITDRTVRTYVGNYEREDTNDGEIVKEKCKHSTRYIFYF
jgi:hypothetical protein